MKTGRKPKVDWELYKDQLLTLKYKEGKSLTQICTVLYEKLGVTMSAGRVSQVFTKWADEKKAQTTESFVGDIVNANRSH